LDVIKTADWIVDLGPEGGDGGGLVIAAGTPEDLVEIADSYTGEFLPNPTEDPPLRPQELRSRPKFLSQNHHKPV